MQKSLHKKNMHELMDVFYKKCDEHRLKVTPQRIAVYRELTRAEDHPSAEVMHRRLKRRFPRISLDTVNRTLLTFSQIGIANVVEGYGEPKRFDSNTDVHHHFRCIACNRIIDFYSDYYDRIKIPEELKKQFSVLRKKVVLEGTCRDCRKR